jgi:hypothetical protein
MAIAANVPVAVEQAAGDVATLGFPAQGIARALPRLLARHVVDEGNGVNHELVRRALAFHFAVGQVGEDAHPGVGDALEGIGHLVLRAAEPTLLHRHEHLKGRARAEGVHEGQEAGPLQELRAADPIVAVDVLVRDHPALVGSVGPRALDLARDRLLLIGDVLIGALAGVDGGDHRMTSR